MNLKILLSILLFSIISHLTQGQDLNSINGTGFNIKTDFNPKNAPENTVILGFQSEWDTNYKWQLVNAHNTDNYYLRQYVLKWSDYCKIWHSGNLNNSKVDFSANKISCSGLTLNYPGSLNPIEALTLDVASFGHYDNSLKSYFFRVRDVGAGGSPYFIIRGDGNVGIGVSSPGAKLDVGGTIRAHEVKVCVEQGCDFVFNSSYKLMNLNELDKYLQANQHLQGIASEREMIDSGVNIKDFQLSLLQKIEELTLYTIEQNKKIEQQNNKIAELEVQNMRIEAIEAKIANVETKKSRIEKTR